MPAHAWDQPSSLPSWTAGLPRSPAPTTAAACPPRASTPLGIIRRLQPISCHRARVRSAATLAPAPGCMRATTWQPPSPRPQHVSRQLLGEHMSSLQLLHRWSCRPARASVVRSSARCRGHGHAARDPALCPPGPRRRCLPALRVCRPLLGPRPCGAPDRNCKCVAATRGCRRVPATC